MEEGAKIRNSVQVPWQRVISTRYERQELVCEVIAVLQKDVILIGEILGAQARHKTVEYLELSHLEYTLLWLPLVDHWHRVLEDEGTVFAGCVHIDA